MIRCRFYHGEIFGVDMDKDAVYFGWTARKRAKGVAIYFPDDSFNTDKQQASAF